MATVYSVRMDEEVVSPFCTEIGTRVYTMVDSRIDSNSAFDSVEKRYADIVRSPLGMDSLTKGQL